MEKFENDTKTFLYISKRNMTKGFVVVSLLVERKVYEYIRKFYEQTKNYADTKLSFMLTGSFLRNYKYQKDIVVDKVNNAVEEKTLSIPKELNYLYFSDEDSVREVLTEKLFGFGVEGDGVVSVANKVKINDFIHELKELTPGITVKSNDQKYSYWEKTKNIKTKTSWKKRLGEIVKAIEEDPSSDLQHKYKRQMIKKNKQIMNKVKLFHPISLLQLFIQRMGSSKQVKLENTKKRSISIYNLNNRKYLMISLLLLLLLSPFIFLLMSIGEIFYSVHLIKQLDTTGARHHSQNARYLSTLSKKEISYLKTIPGANLVYSGAYEYSNIVEETSNITVDGIDVVDRLVGLKDKFFGDDNYDVEYYTGDISQKVQNIYINSGFLVNDISDKRLIKYLLKRKDLDISTVQDGREKLAKLMPIIPQLPHLLANEGKKNYLLLFQNNMELRPAGGFIGSFAVLKVEGGRMNDLKVYDVYDADGQLKGYVKPPDPINRYLNSSGWYLRDSNWDPKFEESAKTAEWFLDKEMNMTFDGVIAVDLNFLDKLMSNFDSIYLKDYGISINKDNFYQVLQDEVENNFFPGSINKKSLLSALVNELVSEVTSNNGNINLNVVKNISSSLEERNIQIYLHDPTSQEIVEHMAWNGPMKHQECSGNCINDFTALVEANVGVDKVNYYIKRSIDLNVEIDNDKIKRTMIVTLENTANKRSGNFPWYRNYLRVFANGDAQFLPVSIKVGEDIDVLEPTVLDEGDLKSAGIYFQIDPQQTVVIRYSWESTNKADLKKEGEYLINIRKQAGTDRDPTNVLIDVNSDSLTGGGNFLYNTTLSRDFVSRIYW